MKINFNIEYRTSWGEEVRVELTNTADSKKYLIPLTTRDGIKWVGEAKVFSSCTYRYLIYYKGNEARSEYAGVKRVLNNFSQSGPEQTFNVFDSWKDVPVELPFYSSAFTSQFRKDEPAPKQEIDSALILKVYYPLAKNGEVLAVTGNCDYLGNWNTDNMKFLNSSNYPEWEIVLDAEQMKFPLEYKFVLVNRETGEKIWEDNHNRFIGECTVRKGISTVLSDRFVHFNIPPRKMAGVALPVFSLRSETSFGIGDFMDLKKLVDWAVKTGLKVVQILPVNDTTITRTWTDSYPYNSISIYAFNPMYINPFRAGLLKDKEKMEYFREKQKSVNILPKLDFESVLNLKDEYFKLLYAQDWKKVSASAGYKRFFEDNSEWLKPYAAFSYLRDIYKTANFREWTKYNVYDKDEVEHLVREDGKDFKGIAYYYFLQYLLHQQLLEATDYGRRNGVVVKGDIPIGINRDSVEAWTEPYYFNMNGQAGAPPDDFSVKGQNWGFPTYRWDVMAADGYKWWKKRFTKMAEYFDAYRIDHILGFFRIWEVPMHSIEGLLGHFTPSLPLSPEEIEKYGFAFDKELHTTPYITDDILYTLFGVETEDVIAKYLLKKEDGTFLLRPEFNTQRKVDSYAYYNGMSITVKEGLFRLINNVLFVEDTYEKGKYHPRIAVHSEPVYNSLLDEKSRIAFDRLYEDFYYVRHNSFWEQKAKEKLPPLIQSTNMLACAEDLGMIPACVPNVLNDLHILSLEIQRMPKKYGEEFGNPAEYPYYSVCTTSTHDTSTLRGWWLENAASTKRYYNNVLHFWGDAPRHATPEICRLILRDTLNASSMLCIIPFQDWMSMNERLRNPNILEERINEPSNPRHYWRYRMNLTIEELMKADDLNDEIRSLVEETGR